MTAESVPPPAAPATAELDAILLAAESADIGFYRADLTTGAIECTPTCKRNLGVPGRPLTLAVLRELIVEEDRSHLDVQIGKAIENRGEYAAEYRVRHADDSIHWISARGRFVNDAGGAGDRRSDRRRDRQA